MWYFILCFILGAASGMIGGYFIYRNNKKRLEEMEAKLSAYEEKARDTVASVLKGGK